MDELRHRKGVALVTGSTRGIGRAIALRLARDGWALAINGRSAGDAMAETLSALRAMGATAIGIAKDMTSEGAPQELLDAAEAELGSVDCIVCNAGVGPLRRADVLDVGADSFDHCIAANARAPFLLAQEAARRWTTQSGAVPRSLIFISSANAEAASLNKAEYCVSKAALAMVAKVFALKLSPLDIQVMDVRPGIIETDLSAPVIKEYERRIRDEGLALTPRVGQPEDVAQAVAAVARGDLPYLAGSVIAVDGGLSMARL